MVKVNDTLYGVHKRFFYVPGEGAKEQYEVLQETVTKVFGNGFQTECRLEDEFILVSYYAPQDCGKRVFTNKAEAERARELVAEETLAKERS